jgi:hypothetical protein
MTQKHQTLFYDFTTKHICEEPTSNNYKTITFNWYNSYFWVYTIDEENTFDYISFYGGPLDSPTIQTGYKNIKTDNFTYITNDKHYYNVYKYIYEYKNNTTLTLYKFYLCDAEQYFWRDIDGIFKYFK